MSDAVPELSSLPQLVQLVIYIGVGIAACGLAVFGYLRKGAHAPSDDFVITGASLADSRPARELVETAKAALPLLERLVIAAEKNAAIDRLAEAAVAIRELMEREADDEARERLVAEEVARQIGSEKRAARPPRPRVPKPPR